MNVLIIEDEFLARKELIRLLTKFFPDYRVVEEISSIEQSINWLKTNSVDLIFMDVQLSDGISFTIFEEVEIKAPVIFTTAYDNYAIRSFEVNSIGYLLKPLSEDKFILAVRKFEKQVCNTNQKTLLSLNDQYNKRPDSFKSRFLIKLGDKFRFIPVSEIAYFFYEDRYTYLVTKQGKREILSETLEQIEISVNPDTFFRLTRNCIASIESVREASRYFGSRIKVHLTPEFPGDLLISRQRTSEFLSWLEQ